MPIGRLLKTSNAVQDIMSVSISLASFESLLHQFGLLYTVYTEYGVLILLKRLESRALVALMAVSQK